MCEFRGNAIEACRAMDDSQLGTLAAIVSIEQQSRRDKRAIEAQEMVAADQASDSACGSMLDADAAELVGVKIAKAGTLEFLDSRFG